MQVATHKMKSMILFYIIVNIINSSQDENIKKPFYRKILLSFSPYYCDTMKWVDSNHLRFLDACIVNWNHWQQASFQ